MDKRVIVLYTAWKKDYWENPTEAPYPNRSYKDLPNWNELRESLPFPGIGVYIKQKDKDYADRPFVYLRIKGIRYDNQEQPYFDFEPISQGRSTSLEFLSKRGKHPLFEALSIDEVMNILGELGEKPPQSWQKLAEAEKLAEWRDWIGQHHSRVESEDVSNDDFEDLVAELFTALGFEVEQMGHKKYGTYPDGKLVSPTPYDFALVYDCKNTKNFYPTEDNKRALKNYTDKFNADIKAEYGHVKTVYSCFVAKSFATSLTSASEVGADILLDTTSLIFLLYERLRLGTKFRLTPLKDACEYKLKLNTKLINDKWPERS